MAIFLFFLINNCFKIAQGIKKLFDFTNNSVVILVTAFDVIDLDLCQECKIWRQKTSQKDSNGKIH